MARIRNEAVINGSYAEGPIEESSIFDVFTSAIFVEKTADKVLWLDGDLTYTIKVSNMDDSTPPLTVFNAVFTDELELDFIVPDLTTLRLDGTTLVEAPDPENPVFGQYVYNSTTGLLTIPIGDLVVDDPQKEITFLVQKAPQ